jgi:hypothetical protein
MGENSLTRVFLYVNNRPYPDHREPKETAMAVLTPASDALPSMIPPSDFPPEDGAAAGRAGTALVSIERRELYLLNAFLAAFSRYHTGKRGPGALREVIARYREALRFYDDQAAAPEKKGSRAGRGVKRDARCGPGVIADRGRAGRAAAEGDGCKAGFTPAAAHEPDSECPHRTCGPSVI